MTTVSRALNGYSEVSPKTRKRVVRVARELGYTPNAQARRLSSGSTESIGFVLSDISAYYDDPYFAQLLAGLNDVLIRARYDLVISTQEPDGDPLSGYRRLVEEQRVDGIIFDQTRRTDERIDYLLEMRMPFVSLGRSDQPERHAHLDIDNEAAFVMATQRLLQLGHRRIGMIGARSDLMCAHLRRKGFERAMKEAGIDIAPELVSDAGFQEAGGYRVATEFLRLDAPPSAIVCVDDLVAIGAIRAARDKGLVVGSDISIIGYNDIPLAAMLDPPLTTIRVDSRAAGRRLAEMLLAIIAGRPAELFREIWPPALVPRDSDGPPGTGRTDMKRGSPRHRVCSIDTGTGQRTLRSKPLTDRSVQADQDMPLSH
ncbi:MAG: LacI family DNA-binding transcriptional regulator [Geminicoccaceae bacterium]|nr:LacI family DNA-binding transcriptional regulator [Geminicoccaceae bacterium]MCB9942600.1 LacI family DNA-binding transcriptional regulator [Geminicoccaceae bacterium]